MNLTDVNWSTTLFMVALHVLALMAFLPQFFSWGGVLWMLGLYYITLCWGITTGFHRLVSHRSFKTPRWLERFLVTCGTLAMQHGPIDWIGLHRHHHKYSDQDNDHHDSNKGFWWSHMGWMLYKVPAMEHVDKFTKDLQKDPYYVWLNQNFVIPQVILGVILYVLGGWSYVIWGVFVRLVLCYHLTWTINSVTHKWGKDHWVTEDKSRDNVWVSLVTFGEGHHQGHHCFPWSSKHNLVGGPDITYGHIRLLEMLGLCWDVKVPTQEELDKKRKV